MKAIKDTFTFHNGIKMPKIGLGTWQTKPGKETYEAVRMALKHGYRHIDTAAAYQNETSVGQAVRDSGLSRQELFITTKLPSHIKTAAGTTEAFFGSLASLGTDYIDLYLIHAPWPWSEIGKDCREGNIQAFKAMEKLYRDGYVRAIGVSNFDEHDLQNIIDHCEIVPHADQIPYFIGLDQEKTIASCRRHNIVVEAYSPLGIGYLLANETIREVAARYGVSPAQICIRWCLQKDTAPLPKTIREERLIENMTVDFVINAEDMAVLDAIKGDPRRWE